MKKCFAKRKDGTCNALDRTTCLRCKFYKPKDEIKNNIFYPYSFKSKRLYREMVEQYERKFKIKFKGWGYVTKIKRRACFFGKRVRFA